MPTGETPHGAAIEGAPGWASDSDSPAPPSGLPDAGDLARLANDLFRNWVKSGPDHSVPRPEAAAPAALRSAAVPLAALEPLPHAPPRLEALAGAVASVVHVPVVPDLRQPVVAGAAEAARYYFIADAARLPPHGPVPLAPAWPAAPAVPGTAAHPAERSAVPAGTAALPGAFGLRHARGDFPTLRERVHGRPLVWLDNAATTQKPQAVIDRLAHFYTHENSNIHRAAHALAARATDAYEAARRTVARFLGAGSPEHIVFVRGATEAINLFARGWGAAQLRAGDEIVVSHLEHHANIVPWQQLARDIGAHLRVIPVDERGDLRLDEFARLLGPRTRLVSVTQVSNALGTVTPVGEIIELAHRAGAIVLVDGAQAVSHMPVDVRALDADAYVFSGHKVFGPTGIGALYAKPAVLEAMQPWQGGGNMIVDVTFERTVYQPPPARFEAGTGNIADAVGLGAALEYLERLGMANVAAHEHDLLHHALDCLREIPGLKVVGSPRHQAGVISFVLAGHDPSQVGQALDAEGIAVRAGHHCAQPILRRFGHEATVRASLAFYNSTEDVAALVSALRRLASDAGARRR